MLPWYFLGDSICHWLTSVHLSFAPSLLFCIPLPISNRWSLSGLTSFSLFPSLSFFSSFFHCFTQLNAVSFKSWTRIVFVCVVEKLLWRIRRYLSQENGQNGLRGSPCLKLQTFVLSCISAWHLFLKTILSRCQKYKTAFPEKRMGENPRGKPHLLASCLVPTHYWVIFGNWMLITTYGQVCCITFFQPTAHPPLQPRFFFFSLNQRFKKKKKKSCWWVEMKSKSCSVNRFLPSLEISYSKNILTEDLGVRMYGVGFFFLVLSQKLLHFFFF